MKMEDTGLQRGAADLREQGLFLDFTIKVEGQEFRVHKFVLVSVSDYFRAMLSGSLSESISDMVDLKGLNADHVSNLIDFIYTGRSYYINRNPKEMLELAVYFQMPSIIRKCRNNLSATLCINNCVNLLSTFKTYSMDDDIDNVSCYIETHTTEVMRHYKAQDITPDVVQIILDNWSKSEWDMFQFLRSWIHTDVDNREIFMSEFMNHVRFSIMSPQHIKEIREMDEFVEAEGSWKDLVEKAFVYHELPILQKVADDSEQSKLRLAKSAFLLDIGTDKDGKTKFSVLVKNKNKTSCWKKINSIDSPQVAGKIPYVLEANNFLITCSEFGENQTWQVFDPITLTWTKMPNMPKPRDAFAMVYHDKHLYVLGGTAQSRGTRRTKSEMYLTDTVNKYSFETNSWSCTKKLPVAVKNHSACVIDAVVYMSGGEVTEGGGLCKTARMDCLDITSHQWQRKAPMHKEMTNHKMCVMTIKSLEAIVVIDHDLKVRYYNPASDQWSSCDMSVHEIDMCGDDHDQPSKDVTALEWSTESMMLVDGNTVYLLNLHGMQWVEYDYDRWDPDAISDEESEFYPAKKLCVKWRVAHKSPNEGPRYVEHNTSDKNDILQFAMADFPVWRPYWYKLPMNIVGGVLAFSPDIFH